MAKTKQTTIKAKNTAIRDMEQPIAQSPWLEDYMDLMSFKLRPMTEAGIERLAKELMLWASHDKANDKDHKHLIRISQFVREKKIPARTFERWRAKYPILKEAYEYALTALADKRESGAATREYDSSVLKQMWFYDADWKTAEEWRSKLKADSNPRNEAKVVVMSDLQYQEQTEN